jgi:hypothetical protein
MDARKLREQGESDALVGAPIESFYDIPGINHSDAERKEYEKAYRSTDAELRREGR